jgi:hypothetical protein
VNKGTFTGSGLTVIGMLALAAGCNSGGAPPSLHEDGYKDTPPASTPPTAAGTPRTNDPSNPLPAGGMTVPPPKAIGPDENSSGTMQNRTSSP